MYEHLQQLEKKDTVHKIISIYRYQSMIMFRDVKWEIAVWYEIKFILIFVLLLCIESIHISYAQGTEVVIACVDLCLCPKLANIPHTSERVVSWNIVKHANTMIRTKLHDLHVPIHKHTTLERAFRLIPTTYYTNTTISHWHIKTSKSKLLIWI